MQNKVRFVVMIVLILAGVVWALPGDDLHPAEAGGSWSAWLYNSDSGRLVHAFPDGAPPTEIPFPLPPGVTTYPWSVTISRDGAYLAACYTDTTGSASVQVYDIYDNVFLGSYFPAGPIIDCGLSRYSFSEDGSQLAVGVMNHYPDPADTRPEWQLIVMDTFSGAVLYEIASNSPSITSLGVDVSGSLPLVSTFQMRTGTFPGLISFKAVRWGTEPWPEYDPLVWQLDTGGVTVVGPYGKSSLDLLLPNGEAIWIEENDAYPKGFLEGPGYLFNVVMYSNKAGDLFPIFTDGSVLYRATFIDDGRKVAVQTYSGVEQWKYVDRSGATGSLPGDIKTWQLYGTLDGYAFLNSDTGPGGAPELRYHRFNASGGIDAFIAWNGAPGEYWQLIWVNPLTGGAGLPPFPAISGGTPPSPGSGTLTVGGAAVVQTTEGDMLRVRTGPGTSFGVSFQVPNGTRVSILEGPVTSADGLIWWRIDAPGRGTGWAVEGVMDRGVYLQTLVPVP
jgi:hypothetical protein